MNSQTDIILKRLQEGRVLTPLDALNDPEIRSFRLGARIWDLKKQGFDIETKTIETESGKRVAAYRLRPRTELF
jgi:hypothetical protein